MTERPSSVEAPADISLMRRLREGSEQAAEAIVDRYADRLKALARAKSSASLASREDPEDIVQSAFGSFFRGVRDGRYEIPTGRDLWNLLLVIALNKVRAKGAYHRAAKRDVRVTQTGFVVDPAAPIASKESADDIHDLVGEALEGLPAINQQMVSMRIDGNSLQEIADATGRSCRTVERVLKSFREVLAHSLAEDA